MSTAAVAALGFIGSWSFVQQVAFLLGFFIVVAAAVTAVWSSRWMRGLLGKTDTQLAPTPQGARGTVQLHRRSELVGEFALPIRAKNADDILIVARTARFVVSNDEFFTSKLRGGCRIRFALPNLDNDEVVRVWIPLLNRGNESNIERTFKAQEDETLEFVKGLKRNAEPAVVRLEVRLFDYVPPLSIVVVDGQSDNGNIIVEMGPYQVGTMQRPWFRIDAKRQPEWFGYFRDNAERVWRDAKPYPLDTGFPFISSSRNS